MPRQPACASGQTSKLSADDVLEPLLVEAQIGDNLPQLTVLVLELLEPAHLGRQQTVILLVPIKVSRLADPGLAADIHHRHTVGALLVNKRLLGVRKSETFEAFIALRSSQPGNHRGKL